MEDEPRAGQEPHSGREPALRSLRRTAGDLDDCVALLEAVFAADGYPEVWPADPAAWITPARTLAAWIVRCESSAVGHIALGRVDAGAQPHYLHATGRTAPELVELKRFFVHPAMRRAGIADQLHDASIALARARRLHPVLETVAENERAIRFYERRGWRRIGSAIAHWRTAAGEHPVMALFALPD